MLCSNSAKSRKNLDTKITLIGRSDCFCDFAKHFLEVDSIIALLRLIEAESAYYLDKIEEPSLVKKFCLRNQMTKLATLTQRSDFCAPHSGISYFDPYKMVRNQIYLPHQNGSFSAPYNVIRSLK